MEAQQPITYGTDEFYAAAVKLLRYKFMERTPDNLEELAADTITRVENLTKALDANPDVIKMLMTNTGSPENMAHYLAGFSAGIEITRNNLCLPEGTSSVIQ